MKHLVLMIAMALAAPCWADLRGYVNNGDASYEYGIEKSESVGATTVDLVKFTSQTWQGIPWTHYMAIVTPPEVAHDTALIHITGGDNSDKAPGLNKQEVVILKSVAEATKSVTAVLFQVPNQPLFDGLNEDQIIAYSYDKYLTGQGEDWPLLFPMVKSAVRAMDTITKLQEEKQREVGRFVLTGGSKRGWTSWLAGAIDSRVRGIAPVVIDVLNMAPQMEHMFATYGGYSNQIEDYTRLRIQERMQTAEGQELLKLVDPWYYLEALEMPKLVVLGANDPYWTVDAANFYYDALRGDKRLYYQANTAHDIGLNGIATVSEWYGRLLTGASFPEISWEQPNLDTLKLQWTGEGGEAFLWTATSPNRDFREQTWTKRQLEGAGAATAQVETPESGWIAYYVEVQFPGSHGMPFGVTSKMTVLPEAYPTAGRAYDAPVAASEQEAGQ